MKRDDVTASTGRCAASVLRTFGSTLQFGCDLIYAANSSGVSPPGGTAALGKRQKRFHQMHRTRHCLRQVRARAMRRGAYRIGGTRGRLGAAAAWRLARQRQRRRPPPSACITRRSHTRMRGAHVRLVKEPRSCAQQVSAAAGPSETRVRTHRFFPFPAAAGAGDGSASTFTLRTPHTQPMHLKTSAT